MNYRAATEFGTLIGELLADLERFRPGLPATAPLGEIHTALAARARLRLEEIYREYRVDDRADDPEATAQLALYQREVDQILLPRYAALCQRQNELERSRTIARRGPDLYNRITYAVLFFVLGVLVVWAPFVPVYEKWIPFACALLAPLGTPWLPDLYRMMLGYRHQLELGLLHQDLDRVGRALPLPVVAPPALAAAKPDAAQSLHNAAR